MPIENNKLVFVPRKIYHAATVCCPDEGAIINFGLLAGKSIAWTMVSNIWLKEFKSPPADPGIHFPMAAVKEVWHNSQESCVPFVRISPHSRRDFRKKPEELYSVERIAAGHFDDELREWALAARQFAGPLIVEFGAEMNGKWQPWNAKYNGAGSPTNPLEMAPDGKARYLGQSRYRRAHIKLIEICREVGAENITWMFHVNNFDNSKEVWNRMEGYYPGDEYIDWIGVSCYAAHSLEPLDSLKNVLDPFLRQIRNLWPGESDIPKPIAIAELGAIDYPPGSGQLSKAQWIEEAYHLLAAGSNEYGLYRDQIRGVSWWDETWWSVPDDGQPPFLANNAVGSSPEAAEAYRQAVSSDVLIPLNPPKVMVIH